MQNTGAFEMPLCRDVPARPTLVLQRAPQSLQFTLSSQSTWLGLHYRARTAAHIENESHFAPNENRERQVQGQICRFWGGIDGRKRVFGGIKSLIWASEGVGIPCY
jgi:hypothetical protein